MPVKSLKRFEVWLVNWNPGRGSEQEGIRPSLIIQTDAGNINPNYPNTIVLAISTKGRELLFHIKGAKRKYRIRIGACHKKSTGFFTTRFVR